MDETIGENSLFAELDQLLDDKEEVPLNDFFFKHIRDSAEKGAIFPSEAIDSVFAVLCTDETREHLFVTKKSYERAKKVFKFYPNSKSESVTNDLISDILNHDSTIDKSFFGFISEDIAKKILRPNQWLVRCDDDGFIITLCRREDLAAPLVYENYRVHYNEDAQSYSCTYNGEEISSPTWNGICSKINPAVRGASGSPLLRVCDSSRIYNWREGEDDIIGLWTGLMQRQYREYLHSFRWFINVAIITDRKAFFNKALEQSFPALYYPHELIDVIEICLANGADLNDPEHESILNFAKSCVHQGWDVVANRVWELGGDPNTIKDGLPAFFVAAQKKDRAGHFMRNPKLDINIKSKEGLNVAWYCKEKVDLAVFNDKNLDFHEIRDGKSLLDHAIEVLSIPYILKLIQAGIDIHRPSATKQGTYLHAFLIRSKQTKNDDIITVTRAMIEAGIDVQSLNPFYQTPLHIAAALLSPEVVKALIINHKANPNGHQESDSTPLHIAAERGDTNMVNTLLELGANQFIKNARGQIPRDVALFGVKPLFSKDETLPMYTFKAVKVTFTNPPHPQFGTNLAIIGDYLYANEGSFCYLDYWDDYGFYSIRSFQDRVKNFMRMPLNEILDPSKTHTWEEIEMSSERFEESHRADTFLKVNNKLWFNGKQNYLIYDPETKTWSQGPSRNGMVHHHRQGPHYNYYENKILHQKCVNAFELTGLDFTDKTTGQLSHIEIDSGDFVKVDYAYRHGVLQDHIIWFVAYKYPRTLFALNIELRRIFKVFEFDFELTSSLVCFGNRFLISMTQHTENTSAHKLFILDLHTMRHSLHDFELDVVPEKDFNVPEDTKTRVPMQSGLADDFRKAREKVQVWLGQKKYPFGHVSLVIYQTTLIMFGGRFEDSLSTNYMFTIDLAQLVPHLSLEQHAALAVAKNMKKIDPVKLNQVPEDLRNKTNLW